VSGTLAATGMTVASLPVGSTNIPGWTIVQAEVAWGTNSNPFQIVTPYGGCFLDLTGFHDGKPYGGVRQVVNTVPNQALHLTFSLGSQQDSSSFRGPVSAAVILAGQTNEFTFSIPDSTNNWGDFTLEFTAQSSSTPLTIAGTATAGGHFIGLDNISVTPLAPQFQIATAARDGNNLLLSYNSDLNANYFIETRTNLTKGGWETLLNPRLVGTGGLLQVVLTNAFDLPRRFYRLEKVQ
jgi:hypothetical protein